MSAPPAKREPSLIVTQFGNQIFDVVSIYLPDTLTVQQFNGLIATKPAFGFPALQDWFARLLQNLKLQQNADHPHHKHRYNLRAIDIQAVDWFSSTRIGFMKIQAKIETDKYVHEHEKAARLDWLPGAVFLRGGSVAMLVRA